MSIVKTILTASLISLTAVASSSAVVIVEEHFNDLNGSGTGITSNNWGTASGSALTSDTLSFGSIVSEGKAFTGGNTYQSFATFNGTGYGDSTLWFSTMVQNVTDTQNRILFFTDEVGSAEGAGFDIDTAGLAARTANTDTEQRLTNDGDYDPLATNFIVGKIVLNSSGDDSVTVWLNPTNYASEATLGDSVTVTGAADLTVGTGSSIYTRFGASSLVIDEIRLGTELVDVTPIPEPSASALLLAAVGLLAFARRRKS